MTDDCVSEEGCALFTRDAHAMHSNGEVLVLEIEGHRYAIPRSEVGKYLRSVVTAVGCLDGFDADVYTEINGMVREERGPGGGR